jgi:hypothetical protein
LATYVQAFVGGGWMTMAMVKAREEEVLVVVVG